MPHEDEEGHGQDDAFTAAFEERNAPPADKAGDDGAGKGDDQDAGSHDEPAGKDGADPAPADEAEDPWAGASPALIAERDRLIGERDRFKHSDQSQRGRIASMQRTIDQFKSSPQPQQEQPQGSDKDGGDGKGADPEADAKAERLKNLREDYPDLAGPILDLIEEARNDVKALGGRVNPVIDANNEASIQAQERALEEKHPDWRTVGQSQDFAGWAASQPASIQALCGSFDASEVSAALSLFKQEQEASRAKEPTPEAKPGEDPKPQEEQRDDRRDRQLQGGKERTSRGAPTAAGAPDDFGAAFDYFDKRRTRQQGR